MVFSSLNFIFIFLPISFTLYTVCPGRWKNLCLFIGNLAFYFYGVREHPFYLALLVLSILVNYRLRIKLDQKRQKINKGGWLVAGIIYNLSWLFLFKYPSFFAGNINQFFSWAGINLPVSVFNMILPVDISSYTFRAISYLVDVYRKDAPYETPPINFGMCICMPPQLIAGPIVTHPSTRRQISRRRHTVINIEDRLREFTISLGLKVLLASQIGGLRSQAGAIGYDSISTPPAWLGLTASSLQIYFDFYGYSLMAKGLGRLMGFSLPDNFSRPYTVVSMTEFWRRRHMTLGSWFREYVYIPLGGNRKGSPRLILNLSAVRLLTGFWYGAG